jgi:alkanesulfonate monooxygenase SsuD/methylene tetrahydromethanopterin reductase-like flavin-dependent oxidoreductase (luciferase family)
MEARSYRERIGITLGGRPANDLILRIEQFEHAGVETVWSTQSPFDIDLPTLYAAAASRTSRIRLGTSIVPAFTRHPLALLSQARTIESISPRRLRLGIGTSHQYALTQGYGLSLDRSLSQLREYLRIVKTGLHEGAVDFTGEFYTAKATFSSVGHTPVLISALRENAWELAGELSDGGISWNTPVDFLANTAKPALARGAATANRSIPPLVAHQIVAFENETRSKADVREAVRKSLAGYTQTVYYPRMWEASGYPLGPERQVPETLIDALLFSSDDDAAFAEFFRRRLDQGLDELLLQLVPGDDRDLDEARLAAIVGNI